MYHALLNYLLILLTGAAIGGLACFVTAAIQSEHGWRYPVARTLLALEDAALWVVNRLPGRMTDPALDLVNAASDRLFTHGLARAVGEVCSSCAKAVGDSPMGGWWDWSVDCIDHCCGECDTCDAAAEARAMSPRAADAIADLMIDDARTRGLYDTTLDPCSPDFDIASWGPQDEPR